MRGGWAFWPHRAAASSPPLVAADLEDKKALWVRSARPRLSELKLGDQRRKDREAQLQEQRMSW